MFRFLIHCKAALCDSYDDLKVVAWKAWELPCFFAQALHTTSVTHSQFYKHLTMPKNSWWHSPFCVAKMHPKKIHAFCGQWPLCPTPWVLRSQSPLTYMAFHQVIGCLKGYKWRQTSGTQLHASLSNSEVHTEDIGRTVHIYFSSTKRMSRLNKHQKH